MKELHDLYRSRAEKFAAEEKRLRRKRRLYASLRLLSAVISLGAIWQAFTVSISLGLLLIPALIILFMIFVRLHATAVRNQSYFRRLKVINQHEDKALEGNVAPFPDGASHIDPAHSYTFDLDIFGKNSVFQLINRTSCISGEDLLAGSLSCAPENPVRILERQEAIRELAPMVDFRQHFIATGQEVTETREETRLLYGWVTARQSRINNTWTRSLSYLLPAVTSILLLLAIFGVLPHSAWVISFLANLAFTGLLLKEINRIHMHTGTGYRLLGKFSRLMQLGGRQQFRSPLLQFLAKDGLYASSSFESLSKILNFFDQRMNLMVGAILNGFLLSDLHCVAAIDRWRVRYGSHLPEWLNSLFKLDELASFAGFAFNHPGYSYPEFREMPFLAAEKLGHPLIVAGHCVPNDFRPGAGEKAIILTGANMSGKSTFLRSVGVNLVLAYAGAPVFATKFTCCVAGIHSSMRVSDSLTEDTSYFYAELKRLSAIMKELREGKRMFVLLDEILKGTNSADKLYGSTGLVEEFIRHDCLCLIATHDLDLGKTAETHPGLVSNYCFESTLAGDELEFDYTIRKGIARNKNATFLMKKTGLID